jgi:hypothetical protein
MEEDKDRLRNEMNLFFTKFINHELSPEDEYKLTLLYLKSQYDHEPSDENHFIKWFTLGWYIDTFLIKK